MLTRRIHGLAVAAVIALAGTLASAQDSGGGGRGGFGGGGGGFGAQVINSRDLDRYQDMLNLTRDQRDTVKALFEGYQEQSRTATQDMRDKMAEMRDQMQDGGGDASARRGFAELMTSARAQREKMEASLFSDIQAILTPEQTTLWPKVERTRRREQYINRGLMSGERADVIRIVEQENLPADVKAKLAPILDQYELDLDRDLTARVKLFDANMAKFMELVGAGNDPDKLQSLMKESREASVRVRDLNRKTARQVEELLPDDKKASFQQAFKRESFRNVYQPTQASRQLASAAGFADLTEEQKTGIAALRESHARETAAAQEQLAQAIEHNEMNLTADQLTRRFGGMMGGGRGGQGGGGQGGQGANRRGGDAQNGAANGNDRPRRDRQERGQAQAGQGAQSGDNPRGRFQEDGPVGELRQKVREMDRNTQESLKKILRPEQVDRLPEPDRGDRDGGGDPRQRRRDQLNRT
jgi:Spy/CpxP family protein refolding chaperone